MERTSSSSGVPKRGNGQLHGSPAGTAATPPPSSSPLDARRSEDAAPARRKRGKRRSLLIIASAATAALVVTTVLVASGLLRPAAPPQFIDERFSTPVLVASPAGEWSAHVPGVASDPASGTTYVSYVMSKGGANSTQHGGIGEGDLYVKRSADGGRTFSEPVRVNPKQGDVYPDHRVGPRIDVGPGGEVYVLWVNATPSHKLMHGMRTLHLAVSADSARTFSPPVTIVDKGELSGRSFYGLDVSADGKVYVAWLDSPVKRDANGTLVSDPSRQSATRFARSTDGGRTFSPSVAVGTDPCPCCNVYVLAGQGDDVFVSWRGVRKTQANATVRDIVLARSTDGGQSFASPVTVHDDGFEISGCVHVGAPMAIDPKGRLHVAWFTGKEESPGIYHAVSSDGGLKFSDPVAVVRADWVPPSRVELALDSKGNAWLAYEYPAELGADPTGADPIWRYNNASALIRVTKIDPEGGMRHSSNPLNSVDGRVPVLAAAGGAIVVLWGDVRNDVWASTAPLQ